MSAERVQSHRLPLSGPLSGCSYAMECILMPDVKAWVYCNTGLQARSGLHKYKSDLSMGNDFSLYFCRDILYTR